MPNEQVRQRSAIARWGFRGLVIVVLPVNVAALGLMLASWSTSDLVPFWMILTFGLSSVFLFARQPQFAALFALIASSYSEAWLALNEYLALGLSFFAAPLLWALIFEHPIRLNRRVRPFIVTGFWISLSLSMAAIADTSNATMAGSGALITLMIALIILTERCFNAGLWKSPRTIIFALCMAPLTIVLLSTRILHVGVNGPALLALNLFLGFAPLGCLFYEAILRTKTTLHKEAADEPA